MKSLYESILDADFADSKGAEIEKTVEEIEKFNKDWDDFCHDFLCEFTQECVKNGYLKYCLSSSNFDSQTITTNYDCSSNVHSARVYGDYSKIDIVSFTQQTHVLNAIEINKLFKKFCTKYKKKYKELTDKSYIGEADSIPFKYKDDSGKIRKLNIKPVDWRMDSINNRNEKFSIAVATIDYFTSSIGKSRHDLDYDKECFVDITFNKYQKTIS